MTYIIIGNGVASVAAIEGIREYDRKGKIVVISEEPVKTYGRPLISYYLAGKVSDDKLWYRPDAFYKKNEVELVLGTRIESVDPAKKVIVADNGDTFEYDKLLLATGGRPFTPSIENGVGPDTYHFTTLAHAQELMKCVDNVKKAAVIGAGLIALKAAEGLAMRGVEVTLVVRSRIMRSYFDETAGDMLVSHLRKKGVKFMLQAKPKSVDRDEGGQVKGIVTDQGYLETDTVIMAAGVTPASSLAKEAGLKVDRGVVVDDYLQTSDPDVFAAGDVAEAKDLITGEHRVIPIWPNAYNQGLYAGRNMAGAGIEYSGTLSMNSISYFGLPTQSVGIVNPEGDEYEVEIKRDKRRSFYRKLVFKGERLVGYVLIGDIDGAGVYTSFIEFNLPITGEIREKMIEGEAGILNWPEEFFHDTWNPARRVHVSG